LFRSFLASRIGKWLFRPFIGRTYPAASGQRPGRLARQPSQIGNGKGSGDVEPVHFNTFMLIPIPWLYCRTIECCSHSGRVAVAFWLLVGSSFWMVDVG